MTGDDFRQRRTFVLGWTQVEASQALGLSVNQIRAIENGRSKVTKTVALLFGLYQLGMYSYADLARHVHEKGRQA